MTKRRLSQRGSGGIGCVFMVLLAAVGIYAGIKYALPELRHRSFEERVVENASYYQKQTEEYITKRIIETAVEFDIPLTPKEVHVSIEGASVVIDVRYEKTFDLEFYQKQMVFKLHRRFPY